MKSFEEISAQILQKFGTEAISESNSEVTQPFLSLSPNHLLPVCKYLRDEPELWFDFLACLSGVDYGESEDKIGVVYHLNSLIHEHQIVLKCFAPRDPENNEGVRIWETEEDKAVEFPMFRRVKGKPLPALPSVAGIWRTANWHERETYDLLGIVFEGHPDLRRILLPEDWDGHPLRKDYETADSYHNIQIDY